MKKGFDRLHKNVRYIPKETKVLFRYMESLQTPIPTHNQIKRVCRFYQEPCDKFHPE